MRAIYYLENDGTATLCPTHYENERGEVVTTNPATLAKLPKTIPAKIAELNQNTIKLISKNNTKMANMYPTAGLLNADMNGQIRTVRAEADKRSVKPQKLRIALNATTNVVGQGYYVGLFGSLKVGNLLKTQAGVTPLPVTVVIGGTDGTDTVNYLNDFAQRGFMLKGMQIDASAAGLFTAGINLVQHYTLANETASQITTSNYDVQWGISDMSQNLTQRKFSEREFTARVDNMVGLILGVYSGFAVTYTFDLYSSASGVGIYELVD